MKEKIKEKPKENTADKKYWFKKKRSGLGWQPASIEGWLVTIGFIIWIIWLTTVYRGVEAVALGFLSIVFLIYIVIQKAPKLEWGRKKKNNK
ncbi:MAG: hypothetical protein KAS04_05145 [Candidatus Aenigmarchaeota archaeon]|nr:hypothetical protein [Candidatus Aenigmarchaeota archaeon]